MVLFYVVVVSWNVQDNFLTIMFGNFFASSFTEA